VLTLSYVPLWREAEKWRYLEEYKNKKGLSMNKKACLSVVEWCSGAREIDDLKGGNEY
jgi:hypothetical protein